MGSPRHGKFDEVFSSERCLPGSMFNSVAELMSWKDLESPAPSYPALFAAWKDTAETDISEVLSNGEIVLNSGEEDSFQVGQQIGFRALEKFLVKAKSVGWALQSPEVRLLLARDVLARPQIPQRTPAWYAQGKEVMTASEFSKLFGTPRCVSQLVMSKVASGAISIGSNRLACMSCEMGPFDWGIRFEPVVKQILAEKWGVEIADAGRVTHPTDSHMAASPDGVFLAASDPVRVGRLVEIKCPITRTIGGEVPFDYWCQMQIQMEVTGIGECDYVEVKIDSIQKGCTDLSGNADGYVWLLQNPATCEMRYVYTETEAEVELLDGWDLTEKIPWRLNSLHSVTVTRDMAWYEGTAELRREFWKNVEKARNGQFQAVAAKTVIVTKEPAACLIVDEEA